MIMTLTLCEKFSLGGGHPINNIWQRESFQLPSGFTSTTVQPHTEMESKRVIKVNKNFIHYYTYYYYGFAFILAPPLLVLLQCCFYFIGNRADYHKFSWLAILMF